MTPSWGQAQEAEIVGTPETEEDRVTLRVKVKRADGRPIITLDERDFALEVDGEAVEIEEWESAEDATPPPAWVIVLLDFSGSMKGKDSRGKTKYEGAINAIKAFIDRSAESGGDIQMAIVPFGEPGDSCPVDKIPPVNSKTLDRFFPAGDFKLQNYLETLGKRTPCASTNLYEPLNRTVRFLANKKDTRFHPSEESKITQPRLSVILLSDGYHNKAETEQEDFETLQYLLEKNEDIVVHTLGYGLTPEQLGKQYGLGRSATRKDLGEGNGKVPFEEFVDKDRLAEIADMTGGVAEFSGEEESVAEALQLFFNSLLEYQLVYVTPHAQRGSKHEVKAIVENKVESPLSGYAIAVFGRSLPAQVRLAMMGTIFLVVGLGGVLPFWLWGKKLKEDAES
ncbi:MULTISPECIES: vWA domain-containing protein [unclassified Spirulina]|uniref:vWA domain-containing protein n=1 Tax=unclassified Spirulina TaxID=2684457 RepID=UPI00194DF6C0|nr:MULTISPECIES: vWA domain-containing protein [Spirulina]MEA5470373.1 vWA domain-containing protein [Spirulina sp. 06S082]